MSSFIWSSGLGNEASSKVAVGRLQASDISAVCSEGKETKGKEYH